VIQQIFGPSWIWTNIDIFANKFTIHLYWFARASTQGRINFSLYLIIPDEFHFCTLPPREVESLLPPWKRNVINH